MDAEIRRYQDLLTNSGMAVIIFGVWSIFRLFLALVFDKKSIADEFPDIVKLGTSGIVVLVSVISFFLLVDLVLRLYIGKSAIKDAKTGENRRIRGYVILTAIYAVATTVADISMLIPTAEKDYTISLVSSVIIDFLSSIALYLIAISSIKLHKLRRR